MQTNGAKTYTWDARNRLTAIGGASPASFAYDVADRRTTKSTPITSGISTQITFDGANPVLEKQGTTVTGANLTGLGIDSYLARTDGTTETYPLTDHLGNVIALTDATGNIVTTYVYEPYGATTQTGAPSANPHQYTGRENDGTGLYYYRARYYDPQLMRFISEDPIGLAGGVNSYAYVGGNPVSRTDPTGLLFGGLVNAGECYGDSAAQHWADKQVQTGNPLYMVPGLLASLWTPSTSDTTAMTLALGGMAGSGLANLGAYVKNPILYEVGSKTVPTSLFNQLGLGGMSAVERGAALLAAKGPNWVAGLSSGPWLTTLLAGPTPGGFLVFAGAAAAANYLYGGSKQKCGCN